ncbi:MAG: phosphoglycerate dehydrogenase [Dehalococcoidales bacterium]|nr:phosphoglycerate dehydrogenase [Dehalococcoidales bacterium]
MGKVLVSDPLAQEGVDFLRQSVEVDVRLKMSPQELLDVIGQYDALVVRSETKVNSQVIEAGRNLRAIGRAGVGVDNIDVEAATRRGIIVVNAPTSVTDAAAEHTIALMLAMARHIPHANQSVKAGEWQRSRFLGVEVRGKTLGLIGMGNIGREVAFLAKGLRLAVVAYDPFVSTDFASRNGIRLVTLDELLREADFISIHVPLTPSTRGIIGAKELSLVKPTARLINCARGGLVDEEALLKALEDGRLAGAALDVFAQEPPVGSALLASPKIVATPHLGASTEEAQVTAAVDVAGQVIAALRGEFVKYAVNAPALPPEAAAVLGPLIDLGERLGRLFCQLGSAQLDSIEVVYNGEISDLNTTPVKAALVKGILEQVSEEPVNLVNALLLAKSRGLQIVEEKSTEAVENYTSLITLRVPGARGIGELAGTVVRDRPHIVRINHHWVDIVPSSGYLLFTDHDDRPGVIGKVATLLGRAGVNISYIQASRVEPRGEQMMVLGVDDQISDDVFREVLQISEIRSARVVKF